MLFGNVFVALEASVDCELSWTFELRILFSNVVPNLPCSTGLVLAWGRPLPPAGVKVTAAGAFERREDRWLTALVTFSLPTLVRALETSRISVDNKDEDLCAESAISPAVVAADSN